MIMDALGDPPVGIVVLFIAGVALVNIVGYFAWRNDRVGDWYEGAVFATFVPIAVSTFTGSILLFSVGAVSHLSVGSYGVYRWFRSPPQPTARHKTDRDSC
jgi:hypothetical protein